MSAPTPLIMSLSGTRGIIGDNLHPNVALELGMAYGQFVGKGKVIVGGDTRVSHDMVKSAVVSGLLSVGVDVMDVGRVTTPTVQHMIREYSAVGGIVITASHNPVQWNGIKMMNSAGAFLTQEEHAQVITLYESKTASLATWEQIGQYEQNDQAIAIHVKRILDQIDVSAIKTAKLKVLVDGNNGIGAVANPILFKAIGISDYDILEAEPHGRFTHDPEPTKTNLEAFAQALKAGNYDIGFAQDADGDRLVMLDETGRFIGEDYSFGVCVDQILRTHGGQDQSVVVNLSTSKLIEDIAATHGASIQYTPIGESHVSKRIKETHAIAGGEGNGGIIFPKVGWGRDSLVGMTLALIYLAETGKKLSEIVAGYPVYKMSKNKIEAGTRDNIANILEQVRQQYAANERNEEDGVKVLFDDGWLHVRPSNTEPIIRIFAEAPSVDEADARAASLLIKT